MCSFVLNTYRVYVYIVEFLNFGCSLTDCLILREVSVRISTPPPVINIKQHQICET